MQIVRLTESDLARIVERVLLEQVQEITNFDKDYDYKKVVIRPGGNEYFFKLKSSPVSEKAKGLKSQGKFKDWTKATGAGLEAIKTKVFKEAPTNTTKTIAPKPTTTEPTTTQPTTTEPQPTTPELSQYEKDKRDAKQYPTEFLSDYDHVQPTLLFDPKRNHLQQLAKLVPSANKPQSGQVQRQTPSQIPPLTAQQGRKVDRMVNKAGNTQSTYGEVPTDNF